jgi:hypothetical protein
MTLTRGSRCGSDRLERERQGWSLDELARRFGRAMSGKIELELLWRELPPAVSSSYPEFVFAPRDPS